MMGKIKLYPKNEKFFKKLIPFAKKIISICQDARVNPVIYGSFAQLYHTKDENIKINDIDLWIPEKKYKVLIKGLNANKIKHKYFPEGHTLIIKKGKLKVEVDSIDYYYQDLNKKPFPRTFDKIDFYGEKIRIINLKNLEKFYEVAYVQSDKTKNKVKRRIKHLEGFLGRTLKWKSKE